MAEELQDGQHLISELGKAEFRGAYPDIPLPADIDTSAFGESPMFVTLPIAKVGKSRNGYEYTLHAIERIAEQINVNRNEGRWGHLKAENRASEYKPPAVRWLAATVSNDGTLWAKCVPVQEQAKEHFRVAKAANAAVGVSIYGVGTFLKGQVVDFDLESVDLGDPARVGLKDAVARPHITAEMTDEGQENNAVEETQRIAELVQETDGYKAQIAELTGQLDTHKGIISELLQVAGVEKPEELKAVVAEFITARNTAAANYRKELKTRLISELVKVEQIRPLVAQLVGELTTDDEAAAKALIETIVTSEAVKPVAEMAVRSLMGPNAIAGNGQPKKEITPEQQAAGVARYGIN